MIEGRLRSWPDPDRAVPAQLPAGIAAAGTTAFPTPAWLLLVPGFTGSKEDFMPLLRPLAAAGLPGGGRSTSGGK